MTPAEKAKQTRAENKRRAAHREAVMRYATAHNLKPRGVSFGVYANNQGCRDCGASVHQVDLFKDSAGNDVRVCPACVDGTEVQA